jgi:hypothetical protein
VADSVFWEHGEGYSGVKSARVHLLAWLLLAGCRAPRPIDYFPAGTFSASDPKADNLLRDRFAKHLIAMQEPSLVHAPSSVRFLYLRTFHYPIAVRIDGRKDGAILAAVEVSGAGGHEPGGVRRRTGRALTADEWTQLQAQIGALDASESSSVIPTRGLDGAEWILEVSLGGQYHVIERHSPSDAAFSAFRNLCLQFLALAEMTPAAKDLY